MQQAKLQTCFLLSLSHTLKIAAVYSFETSVYFERILWHYNHRCENVKSYVKKKYLLKGTRRAPDGSSDRAHTRFTKECRLLGCGAVQILCEPTFRMNVSLPSSG
jgi:hypothetical protein